MSKNQQPANIFAGCQNAAPPFFGTFFPSTQRVRACTVRPPILFPVRPEPYQTVGTFLLLLRRYHWGLISIHHGRKGRGNGRRVRSSPSLSLYSSFPLSLFSSSRSFPSDSTTTSTCQPARHEFRQNRHRKELSQRYEPAYPYMQKLFSFTKLVSGTLLIFCAAPGQPQSEKVVGGGNGKTRKRRFLPPSLPPSHAPRGKKGLKKIPPSPTYPPFLPPFPAFPHPIPLHHFEIRKNPLLVRSKRSRGRDR